MMTLREKYIQDCVDCDAPYNLETEKEVRITVYKCFCEILLKFNWERADEKDLMKIGCDVSDYVQIDTKLWNVIYNLAMQELKYFTDLDVSRLEYTPVMKMLVEENVIYEFVDDMDNGYKICLYADGPAPHPIKAEERYDDKASENPINCLREAVIHNLIDYPDNLPTRLVDGADASGEVLIEVINKKTNHISHILSRYNYKLKHWDYVYYPDYEVLWWMNIPNGFDLLK